MCKNVNRQKLEQGNERIYITETWKLCKYQHYIMYEVRPSNALWQLLRQIPCNTPLQFASTLLGVAIVGEQSFYDITTFNVLLSCTRSH